MTSLPSRAPTPTPPPARALRGVLARRRPIDACAPDREPRGPYAADWTARRE